MYHPGLQRDVKCKFEMAICKRGAKERRRKKMRGCGALLYIESGERERARSGWRVSGPSNLCMRAIKCM